MASAQTGDWAKWMPGTRVCPPCTALTWCAPKPRVLNDALHPVFRWRLSHDSLSYYYSMGVASFLSWYPFRCPDQTTTKSYKLFAGEQISQPRKGHRQFEGSRFLIDTPIVPHGEPLQKSGSHQHHGRTVLGRNGPKGQEASGKRLGVPKYLPQK